VYNSYDEHGRLAFSLNRQQRDAFIKLWTHGPLSLLQGPPGTGKTSFIASFVHYALSQGAQSILLASQSHEA
jgi:primosomal protein N'